MTREGSEKEGWLARLLRKLDRKKEVERKSERSGPLGSKIEHKYRTRTLKLIPKKRR